MRPRAPAPRPVVPRRVPDARPLPGPLHPMLAEGREYPFVRLERSARERLPPGTKLIRFSAGDPRERTPDFIRAALRDAVPEVSSYPTTAGLPELRAAAAGWIERRFGARLDPEAEILPVNGTKEGIFLLALLLVARERETNPARATVVVPTPAYPVYEASARLAGAPIHFVRLRSEDGWRFDPDRVPDEVWRRTALLWLNFPHNPTGAVLERATLTRIAECARRFGFWVASDEAYVDIYFATAPPSLLECGTDNVIAFHSLSKRSAMTGYRSGFMAGDRRLIEALARFRPHVGVATPEFVQCAAIAAWRDDAHATEQRALYAAKRRLFREAFAHHGWVVEASEATFYLWLRAPGGDDVVFAERLMGVGILATPGSYLGAGGEGYLRWALVPTLDECREAVRRLAALSAGG